MKYCDPNVTMLWGTPDPSQVVTYAARCTMKQRPDISDMSRDRLLKFLYQADHRSPFEHAVACLEVTGVSRAFMAQITRHRLASYTCSSQHYQDYRDYPIVWAPPISSEVGDCFKNSLNTYTKLLDSGMPKDQARMVLPEAMSVNMVITANAREWATILHYRLCRRNTKETLEVAHKIQIALLKWFPDLFHHVGTECFEGECRQGRMSCGGC